MIVFVRYVRIPLYQAVLEWYKNIPNKNKLTKIAEYFY